MIIVIISLITHLINLSKWNGHLRIYDAIEREYMGATLNETVSFANKMIEVFSNKKWTLCR